MVSPTRALTNHWKSCCPHTSPSLGGRSMSGNLGQVAEAVRKDAKARLNWCFLYCSSGSGSTYGILGCQFPLYSRGLHRILGDLNSTKGVYNPFEFYQQIVRIIL